VVRGYLKGATLWERIDEGARILFGPVVRPFDLASRLNGRLEILGDGLALRFRVDADLAQDPREVGRLLASGSELRGRSAMPRGTIACVSLDRDFGPLLESPDRWLSEDGALGAKNFTSVVDQLLGGASLLGDLLPQIEMPLDLFVTASTPDDADDQPRIRLPAFTLVFGVHGKAMQKHLNRVMTTLAAITSAQRVRDKKVPLFVRRGRRDGFKFQHVRFGDWNEPGEPPTEHGLSPTVLFAHGHCVIGSTEDGAMRVAQALGEPGEQIDGDRAVVKGEALADLIRQNASVLTMDRVLKEGETVVTARRFVHVLAAIVRLLELRATVKRPTGATSYELELRRVER
jgi:hypothetical protein